MNNNGISTMSHKHLMNGEHKTVGRMANMNSLLRCTGLLLLAFTLILGAMSDAHAVTVGPNPPSTASGTNWTTPTNVYTSNNAYATFTGTSQNYLQITGFGFALPTNAVISGITVTTEGMSSGSNPTNRRYKVALTKNGTIVAGTEKTAQQFLATDGLVVSGTNVDLWGTTWAYADINASTFGVLLADNDIASSGTFSVDQVLITVDYTVANSTPTLSISQPDGVSDSVTVGTAYDITYALADSDDVVTAAFYYDTDNTGLNGTSILGACATAAESPTVTCSWNTTGMTAGSYYVYGLVDDGVNPQVSAYSTGTLTITAGLPNSITSCAGCHGNPPVNSATRDAAAGTFVGDHSKHNYACDTCHATLPVAYGHRTGKIEMKGAIGISGDNGAYTGGTVITQTNSPSLGSCDLVNCHGNNNTGVWGSDYASCATSTCHGFPPATNAHTAHYTAKGWATGDYAFCVACHPNDFASHADRTDGTVSLANLTKSGSGTTITCSSISTTGCHNGAATTPQWGSTTITCTNCHTVDGTNSATIANPVSGLHGNTVATVQDHDSTLAGGCEACHVRASITGHWNGTASATVDYTKAQVGITATWYTDDGGTAAKRGSCYSPNPATGLDGCHGDGGEWRRQWSSDADVNIVTSPNPGQAVCNVCHGQSGAWNEGTVHYRSGSGAAEDKGFSAHTDPSPDECEDCHAYDSAAVHNSNNKIDFSGNGTSFTLTMGNHATNPGWYCASCHNNRASEDAALTSSHTFLDSKAFPGSGNINYVTGTSTPQGSCFSCHGDGAAEYWPQNATNLRTTNTNPSFNDDGRHTRHVEVIASRLYGETLAQLITTTGSTSDVKQKAICAYCHVVSDYDHTSLANATQSEVFVSNAVRGAKSIWNVDDTNATFNATTYNCTTTDCHNNNDTTATYNWYTGSAMACAMCHTVNPTTDTTHVAHTGAAANYGITVTCDTCHYATTWATTAPTTGHINGTWTTEFNFGTGSWAGVTYDGNSVTKAKGTCATNPCHRADLAGTAPSAYTWGTALTNNCATCHAGTAIGTRKHANHLGSNSMGATNLTYNTTDECIACHSTTTSGTGRASGSQHIDNTQDVSFNSTFDYEGTGTIAGSTGTGDARTCSDVRCHNGVTTPAWAAASTIACGNCHNNAGSGPLPTNAANASGSHLKHANSDTDYTDCDNCHGNATYSITNARGASPYTATGGGGAAGSGLHQNLVVNLYMNSGTGTYTDTTEGGVNYQTADASHVDNGTCGTTLCHGAGVPAWGSTLANGCFDCHGDASPNQLIAIETGTTKPAIDANPNKVNNSQYTTYGHGRSGTYAGATNAGASFLYTNALETNNCYACHDSTIAHAPAAPTNNPFRLKYGGTPTNPDTVCTTACHTSPGIQTHSKAITGSSKTWPWSNYDYKCVDCHDPHGDTNYYMIRSNISAPQTTADTLFGSDSYGTPADGGNSPVVTFTSLTGMAAGSYGITAATADGICEVCHTQTTYWRKDIVAEGHYSTTRCTSCHKHDSGLKASCYGCHGDGVAEYWPQNATNLRTTNTNPSFNDDGRHTRHVEVIASRLYGETLAQLITTTGSTSNVKQKAICAYCHVVSDYDHTSLANATQSEVFVSNAVRGAKSIWNVDDTNATFNATTYNCTTTDCHNNNDTTATYNWYTGSAMACAMCHTVNPTTDTTHVAHTGAAANYGITVTCDTCHYATTWATTAPTTGHINGTWTTEFNFGTGSWAGVTYDGNSVTKAKGTCATNPCHRADLAGTAPSAYTWGTALTNNCATCHAGTAIGTRKHANHLGSNSMGATNLTYNTTDECIACHSTTTSGTGRASGSQHIDNTQDVSFNSTFDYEGTGTIAGSTGTGDARTCSDVRCHNGVTTPAWAAASTIACGNCHNNAGSGPLPTNAANASGSHLKHANSDTDYTDCDNCHGNATYSITNARGASPYTATGGGGAAGSGLHQNLVVNLYMNSGTGTYTDTTEGGVNYQTADASHVNNGTCGTTLCHGAGVPAWGSTLANGCFDCHGDASPNQLIAIETGTTKPAIDANPNKVNNSQYTTYGHGRSGTYAGATNAGASFLYTNALETNNCYACHDSTIAHAPAAPTNNPFRLKYGGTPTNPDTVCTTACHTSPGIQTHSKAITGSSKTWPWSNYAYKCVNCHDPHGDTNYYMIRSNISAPQTTADTLFGSDSYGTPADGGNSPVVTFTSLTGMAAGSYGITAATADGICEVCHTQTTYWRKDIVAEGHYSTTRCTSCHKHDSGLKASCYGCHGDGVAEYWPQNATNLRTTNTNPSFNDDGRHTRHVEVIASRLYGETLAQLITTTGSTSDVKQKAICAYCHVVSDYDHTSLANATQSEVFVSNAVRGAKSIWNVDDTNATFNATTYNCTTTDCHNNNDTTATYNWYTGSAMACAMCHTVNPTTDTTHVAHTGAAANYGITVTCDTCHYATTWATTAPTTGHINGTWTTEFNFGTGSWAGVTYDGNSVTKAKGTCATNPCHRADLAGTAPSAYTWGTALTNNCATCHAGTAIGTRKHANHLGSNSMGATNLTYNTTDECIACHSTTTSGTGRASGSQHIDNTQDVSFNSTFDYEGTGTIAGSTGTGDARTCSDVRCHNGVTTPAWAAASTIACGNCHNNAGSGPLPTNAANASGSHLKHANSDTDYTDCDNCHGNATYSITNARGASPYTATGGGGAAGSGLHQNLVVNLYMNSGTGTYTDTTEGGVNYQTADASHVDNGTCGTTLCHGAGVPAWGSTLANGCFDCHGDASPNQLIAIETGTTKPAIDANPNKVNNSQYTTYGHGRSGTYAGATNAGASFLYTNALETNNCYACHDSTIAHAPAAPTNNPFRLKYGGTPTNPDTVCTTACHTSPGIQTHSKAITGSSKTWPWSNYAYKCVNCHDPHGDTNYYMIRSNISAPQTTADTLFGSDSYGTPADGGNSPVVTFTSLTGMAAGSYGITAATADGICEVCHTQTTYWRKDIVAEGHYSTTRCTSCHKHDSGLKASCYGCHGDGVAEYWPQNATNLRTTNTNPSFNDDGRHTRHVEVIASRLYGETLAQLITTTGSTSDVKQKAICAYCHVVSDYDHTSLANATQSEVFVSNAVRGAKSIWNVDDTNATFNATTYNCTTTDCHNNKDTTATYNWYTGSASACMMCHALGGTNNPTSGLHNAGLTAANSVTGQNHDDSFGTGGTCTSCHTMTGKINGTTGTHINSFLTGNGFTANPDFTAMGLSVAMYTATADNTGTCASTGTNCHGNATASLNYRDDWRHKWDSTVGYYTNSGTACGGCHGDWTNNGTTWNTGVLHRTTANAQSNHGDGGTAYQCKECHTLGDSPVVYTFTFGSTDWAENAGETTSKHGNGLLEINNASGTVYNTTTWSCSVACHTQSDGVHTFFDTSWTTAWLVGSAAPSGAGHAAGADCKGCHAAARGTKRAIQPEFNSTYKHGPDANTWTNMTNADCEACHDETSGPNGVVNLKVVGGTTINTTWSASYSQATLASMNSHCLSCHDGAGTSIMGTAPTTRDNINTVWASTTTTSHTYATGNVTPQKTKARSAHGSPATNTLKDETGRTGYTTAVACLECHPAHGSSVKSPDSSKGNLAVVGNMVKTGYTEPGTCWTCHDAAGVKDYMGDSTTAGTHWSGTKKSPAFLYKQRGYLSTHEVNGAGQGFVCSVCHNPHGSTAGPQYYTPMLRGTWMTSPYPEDRTGKRNGSAVDTKYKGLINGPRIESTLTYNKPADWGHGYGAAGGTGNDGYYIDDNTFGTTATYSTAPALPTQITQTVDNFGGLCASCHTSATWAGGTTTAMKTYLDTTTFATGWGASVHNAVKGWSDGTTNCLNSTNQPRMHVLTSTNAETSSCYQEQYVLLAAGGLHLGGEPERHRHSGRLPRVPVLKMPHPARELTAEADGYQLPGCRCYSRIAQGARHRAGLYTADLPELRRQRRHLIEGCRDALS